MSNYIVVTARSPEEHRFYRLLAEWERYPHLRKTIISNVLQNPAWGIEVTPHGISLQTDSVVEVVGQVCSESPQESNLSRLRRIAR